MQLNPSIQFLEKVARVLNVPVHHFVHHEVKKDLLKLYSEWVHIVKEAKKFGISKKQFLEYLEFCIWQSDQNR